MQFLSYVTIKPLAEVLRYLQGKNAYLCMFTLSETRADKLQFP